MRRIRIGGLAACAALALALVPTKEQPRPLTLATPAAQAPMLGVRGSDLGRVDLATMTLEQITHVGYVSAWTASPDGSQLAIAVRGTAAPGNDSIRIVDRHSLTMSSWSIPLNASASALLWRGNAIIAITSICCGPYEKVAVADLAARRVVARHSLSGDVFATRNAGESLVALVAPARKIGPARLLVVDGNGRVRTAALASIRAGSFWRNVSEPIGTLRIPGLAVDRQGGQAYVVDPGGFIAQIDLATLKVTYHSPARVSSPLSRLSAWLQPPAQAKVMNGPVRTARWLGDGWIAVSGADSAASRTKAGKYLFSSHPAGLDLIDTRDWTVWTLDPGASAFRVADGLLLATGGSYESGALEAHGMGLAAYGADRQLRYRILDGKSLYVSTAVGGRAYVAGDDAVGGLQVVDVATGADVGRRSNDLPWLLVDD